MTNRVASGSFLFTHLSLCCQNKLCACIQIFVVKDTCILVYRLDRVSMISVNHKIIRFVELCHFDLWVIFVQRFKCVDIQYTYIVGKYKLYLYELVHSYRVPGKFIRRLKSLFV